MEIERLLNGDPVRKQLKDRSISKSDVLRQLSQLRRGNISVELIRPAKVGDGIIRIDEQSTGYFVDIYNKGLEGLDVIKFVPASGAASRMFKGLLSEYYEYKDERSSDLNDYEQTGRLMENLHRFAFYDDLRSVCSLDDNKDFPEVVEKLLFDKGLNYSNIPKGLIKFHKDGNREKTAFEEHLVEAKQYIRTKDNVCRVHFTVSEDAKTMIERHLSSMRSVYEDDKTRYDLTCSVQSPSTDTIAVDMKGSPVIDDDGKLKLRPAGHGALIHNLNSVEADMIYIKNVDNVTKEKYLRETTEFKKLLGGCLMFVKDRVHGFLNVIDSGGTSDRFFSEVGEFLKKYLFIDIGQNIVPDERMSVCKEIFNRPIRVCGVVRNEGETGGGPFWIKYGDRHEWLQIVESSQVDSSVKSQADIWSLSTHFNPVDIVCWVRDHRGKKFDLKNYVDPDAGIITSKSAGGKEFQALELPGLWNGAMAGWLTVLVEVPLATFNPVKSIFDLLRSRHIN